MIFDTLNNVNNYKGLGRVYDALKFLSETDFSKIELGRYELDGDNIFYMVQSYDTDPDKTISEAHKKYIDIQYMVEGEEIIGVADISSEKELKTPVALDPVSLPFNVTSSTGARTVSPGLSMDITCR